MIRKFKRWKTDTYFFLIPLGWKKVKFIFQILTKSNLKFVWTFGTAKNVFRIFFLIEIFLDGWSWTLWEAKVRFSTVENPIQTSSSSLFQFVFCIYDWKYLPYLKNWQLFSIIISDYFSIFIHSRFIVSSIE